MRFIILLLMGFLTLPSFAEPAKNTLVIHSYHQGLLWTDALQAGLEATTRPYNIPLNVSYMDTKRYQSEFDLAKRLEIYRDKLANEKFDAIVVTDDYALWLVNQLADEVGNTPIILGGINDYTPEKHEQLKFVTGVLEVDSVVDNIQLVRSLQPNLKHIYFLADDTYTGRTFWAKVESYLAQAPMNGVQFTRLPIEEFSALFDHASKLPPDSAVIFLSYFKDSAGRYMASDVFLQQFTERVSAPVYVSYRYMLDLGATGGVVTSGVEQGRKMGSLLVKVLNGKQGEIPEFINNSTQIAFNYQQLKRWGLTVVDQYALLINKPITWYEYYNKELKALSISVALMGVVIVLLVLMIRQLRKSEQQLQQSQALFEGVFDQSFQYIGILDSNGVLIFGNLALQNLLGHKIIKYDRPLWRWHCWQQETAVKLNQTFISAQQGQLLRFEAPVQSIDDGIRVLDISVKNMPTAQGESEQVLIEARDVTSRHQMEDKLREREVSYRLLYEQQPVILLAIDSQARIQSVNQFAADLLGYKKRDMLGHKVTDFYLDDDVLPQQFISNSRLNDDQIVWRRQVRYKCAEGKSVWVRETIRSTQSKLQLLLVGEDITSTRELEEKLEYQACHDYLTGLLNRNYFETQLENVLVEARENDIRHAMFYIDLDQFKVINDTAGHEAGDEALRQVALLLQDITPEHATLSRLGGDEFAIILRHCTQYEAVTFGDEILHLLEEAEFFWQNTRFSFSCSLGIRLIDETAGSPQQVHAQADTACYAAKDEGRNRLHLYHPDDEELKRRELEMEYVNHIHKALAEQRFELYAQQIAPVASGSTKQHYEILVRMRNSDGSMVSPGLFMPAAERYNIAHLIDRYVVKGVIEWLQANKEAVEKLELCSINLSGQSMGNRDFVGFLIEQIRDSGLPPSKLCLEITETAAIGNMSEAIQLFTQLKNLGCLIALDDFGSGLSSFGYLKRMPVDIIKIDGMFVRDIAEDEMDFAMVKAINELAKKMGKQTVAEFVENEAILMRLQSLGVDYAQGYLFGKPKPLAELVAELSQDEISVL